MPGTIKIAPQRVLNCKKLGTEFQYYVLKTHSLRKAFISIKGIYYQVEILGQTITWIVPFKFTQKIGTDVDYKVMLSFLEFYETLLGFVNFKLFHVMGLNYPPKISEVLVQDGGDLEAIQEEVKQILGKIEENAPILIKKTETDEKNEKLKEESKNRLSTLSETLKNIKHPEESSTEESIDEGDSSDSEDTGNEKKESDNEEDALFENDETTKLRKELSIFENLFEKCYFWLSREVPRESLEFVIKSFGGKVTWEGAGVNEENEDITHQIVDRADTVQHRILSRDYVQPQWVYDCLNARVLIPIDLYLPGTTLPPHLSPFVDDYAEGYIPEYRKILDQLYKEANGIPTDTNPVPIVEEESESDEEERFADDLAAEKEGKYEPSKKKTT